MHVWFSLDHPNIAIVYSAYETKTEWAMKHQGDKHLDILRKNKALNIRLDSSHKDGIIYQTLERDHMNVLMSHVFLQKPNENIIYNLHRPHARLSCKLTSFLHHCHLIWSTVIVC